jgi:hypothetical protein
MLYYDDNDHDDDDDEKEETATSLIQLLDAKPELGILVREIQSVFSPDGTPTGYK